MLTKEQIQSKINYHKVLAFNAEQEPYLAATRTIAVYHRGKVEAFAEVLEEGQEQTNLLDSIIPSTTRQARVNALSRSTNESPEIRPSNLRIHGSLRPSVLFLCDQLDEAYLEKLLIIGTHENLAHVSPNQLAILDVPLPMDPKEELDACSIVTRQFIGLLDPDIIVPFGETAANHVIQKGKLEYEKAVGNWYHYYSYKVLPTLGKDAILSNHKPSKTQVLNHMKILKEQL